MLQPFRAYSPACPKEIPYAIPKCVFPPLPCSPIALLTSSYIQMSQPFRANSPACPKEIPEVGTDIICPLIHVYRSYGIQIVKVSLSVTSTEADNAPVVFQPLRPLILIGYTFGRVDMLRTMHSRIDSMKMTAVSDFKRGNGVIRVMLSGYGPLLYGGCWYLLLAVTCTLPVTGDAVRCEYGPLLVCCQVYVINNEIQVRYGIPCLRAAARLHLHHEQEHLWHEPLLSGCGALEHCLKTIKCVTSCLLPSPCALYHLSTPISAVLPSPLGAYMPVLLHVGAVGAVVRNNYVHDFVFAGITCGNMVHSQGDCMLSTISNNLVVAAGRNLTGGWDATGIYFVTHWNNPGNLAECNYIIGGDHCYYLDYASSGVTIRGGACIGTVDGMKVNNGKWNCIEHVVMKGTEGTPGWCTCLTATVCNCLKDPGNYWDRMRAKYYSSAAFQQKWPWMKSICNETAINGVTCNTNAAGTLKDTDTGKCSGLPTNNYIDLVLVDVKDAELNYRYCEGKLPNAPKLNTHQHINVTAHSAKFFYYGSNDLGVMKGSPIFKKRPGFKSCPRRNVGPKKWSLLCRYSWLLARSFAMRRYLLPLFARFVNFATRLVDALCGFLFLPPLATRLLQWLLPLEERAVLRAAYKATGLRDYGEGTFLTGLRLLLKGLEEEARLSAFGRILIWNDVQRLLRYRLQLEDTRRRHPEIEEEKIEAPVFILGLPRTGTTFLFNLLALAFPPLLFLPSPIPVISRPSVHFGSAPHRNDLPLQPPGRRHIALLPPPSCPSYPRYKQAPVFILGLPRTGTTFLFNQLALDSSLFRSPLTWEVHHMHPPPDSTCYDTDKRIGETEAFLEGVSALLPSFQALHPVTATGPQECMGLMIVFSTLISPLSSPPIFPSYLPLLSSPPIFPSYLPLLSSPPIFPSYLPLLSSPPIFPSYLPLLSPLLSSPPIFPSYLPLLSSPPIFPSYLPLLSSPPIFPSYLPLLSSLLSSPPIFPSYLPSYLPLLSSPPIFPSYLPLLSSPPIFPSYLPLLSSPPIFPSYLPLLSSPPIFPSYLPLLSSPPIFPSYLPLLSSPPIFPSYLPLLSSPPIFPSYLPLLSSPPIFPSYLPLLSSPPIFPVPCLTRYDFTSFAFPTIHFNIPSPPALLLPFLLHPSPLALLSSLSPSPLRPPPTGTISPPSPSPPSTSTSPPTSDGTSLPTSPHLPPPALAAAVPAVARP
ncbi:unnamed protein product [Closterium sp. Yama58-4]|nr:unnamed protein product [Closterium sp. Yama58-4]